MAFFAVGAFVSGLAFVTVRWPGDTGRYLKIALVLSIVGVAASAAIAMLAAARDTYASGTSDKPPEH